MRISLNAGMWRVRGQVRAAAQVLPAALAGLGVEVVVDGQLAAADLHVGASVGVGAAALEADQLQLVRLVGQLGAGLVVGDHAPGEPLARLDDLLHPLLDALEVVGRERRRARRSRSRSRSRSAGRCRAWPPGRAPAPPGPARARSSAAATARPSGRVDRDRLDVVAVGERVARGRAARRPTRATTTVRSSPNTSAAVVPAATCRSLPSTVMRRSDTGCSFSAG